MSAPKCKLEISSGDSFVLGISTETSSDDLQKMAVFFDSLFASIGSDGISDISGSPDPGALIVTTDGKSRYVLMYADTLYAHNLMVLDPELTLEVARERAREDGERRLQSDEFRALLEVFQRNGGEVIRWDDILDDSEFEAAAARVASLYVPKAHTVLKAERDVGDEKAVEQYKFSQRVDGYVGQRVATVLKMREPGVAAGGLAPGEIAERFRRYMLEECAAQFVIAKRFAPNYLIYHGKINPPFMSIHDILYRESPGKMIWNELIIRHSATKRKRSGGTKKKVQVDGGGGGGGGAGAGADSRRIEPGSARRMRSVGLYSGERVGGAGVGEDIFDMSQVKDIATEVKGSELELNGLFMDYDKFTKEMYLKLAQGQSLSIGEAEFLRKIKNYIEVVKELTATGRQESLERMRGLGMK